MTTPLLQQLRALADARAERDGFAADLKRRRDAFDEATAGLVGDVKEYTGTVAALELSVRALTEEAYRNTSEKKPAPGVEIKLFKTLTITSPAEALAWAQHTKMALIPESVDEKALLKIAAATMLPFVHYGEEPRVTIATQLNAALYAEVTA